MQTNSLIICGAPCMSLEKLVTLVQKPDTGEDWSELNTAIFKGLLGAPSGRYPANFERAVAVRAPTMSDKGVSYAAYVHKSSPPSGPYGGMSFAIFPVENAPCLVSMVIGTQGLSPDEGVLSRPGHARKI